MKPLLSLSVCLLAGTLSAQIAIPAYASTFSAGATRGFYFTAPALMIVTHLQVPDEKNVGKQIVGLYKLKAPPPAFSSVVDVNPEFYADNQPSSIILKLAKPVIYQKGEVLAVIGACGATTGSVNNSYAAAAPTSHVLGSAVTLYRCGSQINIATTKGVLSAATNSGMWSENSGSIARVRVFIAGAGDAMPYGVGTGTAQVSAGKLRGVDWAPPVINKTAQIKIKPVSASNTGGILAISTIRSSIKIPGLGELLAFPWGILYPVGGPIPKAGAFIKFPIPNDSKLVGQKVTFQAVVGFGANPPTLSNGLEWNLGQ